MSGRFLIGVDIGGTFTDCAVVERETGAVHVGKAPTTPDDHSRGFFDAVASAGEAMGLPLGALVAGAERLAHGTTVATNALVSRSGARVGLVATKGHGQAIFIADNASRSSGVSLEQLLHYPSSYGLESFVHRSDVREVDERVDRDGDVVVRLDEDGLVEAVRDLVEDGIESLAVCFLWSFMNRAHERRALELVHEHFPDLPVCSSSDIASRIGEYPRMATTVVNAYISPAMAAYVTRIEERASELGLPSALMFMRADGGLATADEIVRRPIESLSSGPVAGVMATVEYGAVAGDRDVITTDVGGTTLDVSVVTDGEVTPTNLTTLQQHVLLLDHVDVQSVGAGGGSVAWIEEISGTLRVGPHSVGADPGPACYGRGTTTPTVTDADVVLGLLDPDSFFDGRLPLDRALAEEAVRTVADPLGLSIDEAAAAIHRVTDAKMSDLMRSMTVKQGVDPRRYAVYAFGGGGGTHAASYVAGLECRELVVPRADIASVWSALGISCADLRHQFRQPILLSEPFDPDVVARQLNELERRAQDYVARIGGLADSVELKRHAACKYGLQVFEVEADLAAGPVTVDSLAAMTADFEDRYATVFGPDAGFRQAGVVITALSIEIVGRMEKPRFGAEDVEDRPAAEDDRRRSRDVYWSELGERVPTAVWTGPRLVPGERIAGPAVVEYPHTTVVLRPSMTLRVDGMGNLRITTDEDGDDR